MKLMFQVLFVLRYVECMWLLFIIGHVQWSGTWQYTHHDDIMCS